MPMAMAAGCLRAHGIRIRTGGHGHGTGRQHAYAGRRRDDHVIMINLKRVMTSTATSFQPPISINNPLQEVVGRAPGDVGLSPPRRVLELQYR